MFISVAYFWAVANGAIEFDTNILMGTAVADIFIAALLFDGSVINITSTKTVE